MEDSRLQTPAQSAAAGSPDAARAAAEPSAHAEAFAGRAVALGADGAATVSTGAIVNAEWVLLKCRFGCPHYAQRRTCPPYSPTVTEFRAVLGGYRTALLVWVEVGGGGDLPQTRRCLHEAILGLEREAFLAGHYKALGLLEGTCLWCADDETCTPAACRHPEKVRPSLSGCGVDVFAMAAAAGVRLRVVGDHAEAYRLLGLVLIA